MDNDEDENVVSDTTSAQNSDTISLVERDADEPTFSKFQHLKRHRIILLGIIWLTLSVAIALTIVHARRKSPSPDTSPNPWIQLGSDISDPAKSEFGSSISLSGDGTRLAVGASIFRTGSVNVFELHDDEWTSIGSDVAGVFGDVEVKPSATFPVESLGLVVVLSGDGKTLAVGLSFHDVGNIRDAGLIQIFRFKERLWLPLGNPIVGEKDFEYAGASISLSSNGDTVAIGSPGGGPNGKESGLVRIFKYNESYGWTKVGQNIDGSLVSERFGWSVSLSSTGKIVAVGTAPTSEISDEAVVKVFEYKSDAWNERGIGIKGRAILFHAQEVNDIVSGVNDSNGRQSIGWTGSLSADGSTVVVSSQYLVQDKHVQDTNRQKMSVEAFRYLTERWASLGDIMSANEQEGQSGFVASISGNGDIICIGETGRGKNERGRVRIYKYNVTAWAQMGPSITNETPGNMFGSKVSLSEDGSRFAIGAPFHREINTPSGNVKVFQNPFVSPGTKATEPDTNQSSVPDGLFSDIEEKIPPNIIFIMSDDLGYGDLASYGHPYAKTPHLDQLAAEGTLFQRTYATGSVCNPSRTGFMTSRHPNTFPNYSGDFGFRGAKTITELLNSTHEVGHVGKWHIGPDTTDGTYGISDIKIDGGAPSDPRGKDSVVFDNALKFIEKNKDRPFYLNVWGRATHKPVKPSEILVNNSGFFDLVVKRDDFGRHMQEKFDIAGKGGSDLSRHMANYLADVFGVDALIGELLKKVDDLGLRNNTIIVYTSDQGAAPAGSNTDDLRNMLGYAGGLRGGKHTIFDGGVRIPFIVRWPGKVPAGKVNTNSVISGLDWLPTLCAICGIPINQTMYEGEDISDIWLGSDRSRANPLFWGRGERVAVLYGKWKLHRLLGDQPTTELFDIVDNPEEDINVADKHQNVVELMLKSAEQYSAVIKVQQRGGKNPEPFDPNEPPVIINPP